MSRFAGLSKQISQNSTVLHSGMNGLFLGYWECVPPNTIWISILMHYFETVAKCSILSTVNEDESFNRRNTLSILRIKT
jgi:hypothetical protein